MSLSIIAAMSVNRVIGRDNKLPWRLSADLKRFKKLTLGHSLLMGRKTFESIGRPLPGRTTVVITHKNYYVQPHVLVAHSIQEAIKMATGDEIFIAGGAQLYHQTLALTSRLYLTVLDKEFEGDAYFPEFEESDWKLVSRECHGPSDELPCPYRFLVYERKGRN